MTEPSDPNKPALRELTGRVDKYEIVRSLGKGAMGWVYLAHDTKLDRDVALKVMAAQIADDPELKLRFEREAKAVAKMTHPNIVTVFDLGSLADGSPYIAMEYLKGQDLQKAMRQTPPMTLDRKVSIIVQVLAGLAHAHQRDIVHRDIKPANIFILEDEQGALSGPVKIMDFGVARLTTASMTGTGNIVGTADYMSPEQVKGEKVDAKTDLFAVGCMLFELIAGRRPFHSDSLMAIFYKITHEDANFDFIPTGPEYDALLPVLKKALAKDKGERYQRAYDFAMALREWLRAHATSASAQHALESLVDLEAPTHPPAPMTEVPGVTAFDAGSAGATVDLGTGRRRPGATARPATPGPTRVGGRTVVDAAAGATLRPGATRVVSVPPAVARPAPRPRPVARRSAVPAVIGLLVVAAAGVAGYLYWRNLQAAPAAEVTAAPVTVAPVTTPPPPVATPEPPPVTAAPQPTFDEAAGKAAASLRSAQSAFRSGHYDRAIAAAQSALSEDPGNGTAEEILTRSLDGQKAATRARAAEAALARGDHAAAEQEAQAAFILAPWDPGLVTLRQRIDAAKLQAQRDVAAQAQQQRAGQVNTLLNQATGALADKRYEAAIALYDQVLALDPANAAAQTGKAGAISGKTLAEAAAGAGPRAGGPVRTFVSGRTQTQSPEASGANPDGFEASAGVNVRRGSQAAELPGRIAFDVSPESPKPGEKYSVSVYLMNEGTQPIQVKSMVVVTTINGKSQKGSPTLATSTVAPRDRALLLQLASGEIWREGTTSWSAEVTVITSRGETYKNSLAWK